MDSQVYSLNLTARSEQMEHSMRRAKEFLNGDRSVLKLKDFEGLINVLEEHGKVVLTEAVELVDKFTYFTEVIKTTCVITPHEARERYIIELKIDSIVDGVSSPLLSNTVLFYSFKDNRVHQEISLGNGVVVNSTLSTKEPDQFVSLVRTRAANAQDFNLNVNFRVDKSLIESDQLVRAAGYDPDGNFISITGKGKVALIEDYIVTELGYLPLDKEMSNVFN